MTIDNKARRRASAKLPLIGGAATGLALGILVSVTTDVPLAPEAGLLIGLAVGWLVRRLSA